MDQDIAIMPPAIRQANPEYARSGARMMNGAGHLLWGLRTSLSQQPLLLLSLAVIAANLVVYCVLLGVGLYYSGDVSRFLTEMLPNGLSERWVEIVLQIFIVVAWAMVALFLAIGIASALTGPLLDLLSERTEQLLTGDVNPAPLSIGGFFAETGAILAIMVRSTVLGLLATLLLGWIPVVGQAVPMFVAAMFVALNFIQPTAARHGAKTRERIRMLSRNKALLLGFGLPVSVFPFLLVPLLTPALVVGGTRLYLSLAAHQRVPNIVTEKQLSALGSRR
jgi:CysZ protein